MGFFDNKHVLLIHDPWMLGFMYGDTDDWYAIYIAMRTLNVKSLSIYIPYDLSKYGVTRYSKCIQTMKMDKDKTKYGPNRIVVDYTYDDIASIVEKCDIIGMMAPLKHSNDNVLKESLNNIVPNTKYLFTQGETGKYNHSASNGIDTFLSMTNQYRSEDTKFKKDGSSHTFEELQGIVPADILNHIMIPYKLYKVFCPPPLTNPYVPILYLNGGTNICAIHEYAYQMGVPNISLPVGPNKMRIVEQNNIVINELVDFDIPLHLYIIKDKPELNEPMKTAFSSMIYVARLFGLYMGPIMFLHDLSDVPPVSALPSINSYTNPMWDANTLILVEDI